MRVIGVSGPSCSGKTTLARHLRTILGNSEIVYMDDWYKPEKDLPLDEDGEPDWDVPQSFDIQGLSEFVKDCKKRGTLPGVGPTREEFNNKSPSLLSAYETNELALFFADIVGDEPVLIVEGLYTFYDSDLREQLDLKILCPVNYEILKARREAREGYHTDAGYWKDPPNYFDTHVWPRFLKYSKKMYSEDLKQVSAYGLSIDAWMPSTLNMPLCLKEIGLKLKNIASV